MAQVSKYPMNKGVKERLFELFWKTIASFKTSQEAEGFFRDLLTPTEQTVLTKRLGIAILLLKKYSYPEIVDTLKVSPTTINKIQIWLKTGGEGYKKAVEKIIKGEKLEDFKDDIEASALRFLGGRHIVTGKILSGQKRSETVKKELKRGGL